MSIVNKWNTESGTSKNTVRKIFKILGEMCHMYQKSDMKLVLLEGVCEMDETQLFQIKKGSERDIQRGLCFILFRIVMQQA